MLKDVTGIRLQGANFLTKTELKLFTSNDVSRACLIYGKNGSGKSTTARAFNKIKGVQEETINSAELIDSSNNIVVITEEEAKKIFIFNDDYIDANIRLREEGLDTIVVLGEEKELEEQINEVQRQQKEAQQKFDDQKKICDAYKDEHNVISPEYYRKSMTLSLKGTGNWADRDSKIKGNRQASPVRNDTYMQFIRCQPRKTRDELIVEFNERFSEYEMAKSGLRKIDVPVKMNYEFLFDEMAFIELLAKKLEEPVLTEREKFLLSLMTQKGQGHVRGVKEYFTDETHSTCPYCMQEVSKEYKEKLFLSIEKILSEANKEHQAELDRYQQQEIIINFEPYNDLDKSVINKCQTLLDEFNKLVKAINDYIYTKKENVYSPITIQAFNINLVYKDLIVALGELEKARIEFNKNATDISSRRTKLNEINGDIAYYDINDNYNKYRQQLTLKNKEDVKFDEYSKELEKCTAKVEKLEERKKNIRIAMTMINNSLRYIFFSDDRLSIQYKDDKYYLLSRGNSVTPQKISVGERNAIALCYFFADIMQNKEEEKIYNKEYLLIIDDPVSSFDIENRVGILSFLKYQLQKLLCGNKDTKVLVMTHDIQTFYDMQKLTEEIMNECKKIFGNRPKHTFSNYELSQQTLYEFKLKKRNEYTSLMENIFEYAQGGASEYELVIGNSMRRVLEAFSTFVYKKGIDAISVDDNVLANISDSYKAYFQHLMYRLVLNGGSHAEENIRALGSMDFFDYISSTEKRRTAKDVICFIYLLNQTHVLEHLASKSQVQQTIQGWLNDIESSQLGIIS